MIYAAAAQQHIANLRDPYERLVRPEAIAALSEALRAAERKIETRPESGLAAPPPYPNLARPGRLWTKAGRYRVVYRPMQPPIILAMLFDTADIPGRM